MANEWNCEADPGYGMTVRRAYAILDAHQHIDWQPCLPRLAALAFLSEPDE